MQRKTVAGVSAREIWLNSHITNRDGYTIFKEETSPNMTGPVHHGNEFPISRNFEKSFRAPTTALGFPSPTCRVALSTLPQKRMPTHCRLPPRELIKRNCAMKRPSFGDLPLCEGDPPFSAWSLYGPNDQLGTLNLLTPQVVAEASKEIQSGVRFGLDSPVDYLTKPPHNRKPLHHTVIHKAPRAVHDDLLDFNTQVECKLRPKANLLAYQNADIQSVGWLPTFWVPRATAILQWCEGARYIGV